MTSLASKSDLSVERPFPGLRPYRFEDHDFFFGREDQKFSLYRLFEHSRFVAVVGSSGSGKSSLVRAGFLPLLAGESAEPNGRNWKIIQMHPGDTPIGNLATALTQQSFPDDDVNIAAARRDRTRFALRRSSFGMADALRELKLGAESVMIVVDQFEELFRYAGRRQGADAAEDLERQEEATQFVQLLLAASRDRALNAYILLTMRSDFIGDCANFNGLPEAVSASQFLVPALTRDQREEAIRRPIEKAGATIEPALVERLLNDSGEDLDQLPVLQHCLSRLWEHAGEQASQQRTDPAAVAAGSPRCLTMNDYMAIGAMANALAKHADEIRSELVDTGLAVEQLFRAIAEIDGEGRIVRRARLFGELLNETGVRETDLRAVVDRFRDEDCSFLTPSVSEVGELSAGTRVDVGHEALLRRWDRVSGDPRTGSPYTGWLRAEEADGRDYRVLLLLAESKTGRIAPDQVEPKSRWWNERPRTAAWADRYGGRIAAVEQLFRDSQAAVEAERAAEQHRIELEAQAARAREEAEKARLELEAQTARTREQSALRYARLARRTALAVSALLCLTVGLGAFAYTQWQSALRERANVEKSLQIGGDLTRALVGRIQHYLDTGSVQVTVVKDLLDAARKNLAALESVAQTAAIQAMRANLLNGFSDLYAALQDNNSALQFAQQAQALALQLVSQDADNVAYQNLLYSADFRIGDAESEMYQFDEAMQAYQAALAIARKLAEKDPANYVWMQGVAFVLNKIGDIFTGRKVFTEALQRYQEALAIDQKLAQDNPNLDSLQRDIATDLTRIADVRRENGDLDAALLNYQQALAIRKTLAAKAPDDASLQSNLSVAYNRVADIFTRQKKFDAAAPLYDAALAIRKNLVKADPGNATWQSYVAFEYIYIGDMLMQKQDFAGAAANYRRSLAIRSDLVHRDPKNFTWLKNLADNHSKLGDALLHRPDVAGALAEHKAALALRLRLVTQFPDSLARRRELIDEYAAIGDILVERGDAAGAREAYQSAIKAIDAFLAAHPGSRRSLQERRDALAGKIAALQTAPATNP